ncbi:MAG: ribonuclease Z [Deltaproteobacteria bacterium]|nr:ribonuclease Z [Deltaproteobacteria bacterium]
MELIILGSGTTIPLADRASPSVAIFIEDQFLLMDIGPGTVRQLAVAGLNHEDIDYIAISHFHPDHTADLIHLIFATRHPPVLEKRKPFTVIGPKGFRGFLEFNGFTLVSAPLRHTGQSIGFRIEDHSGNSLIYSGDTGYCEELVDLARGADLLILESAFPDGQATGKPLKGT